MTTEPTPIDTPAPPKPRTISDFEAQYETIDEFEAATAHLTIADWERTFDADLD